MDENFEKRNRYHKKSEVHNLDSKLELRMNNKKHMKKLKKKQVWKNKLDQCCKKNPRSTTEIRSWNYLPYSRKIAAQTLAWAIEAPKKQNDGRLQKCSKIDCCQY